MRFSSFVFAVLIILVLAGLATPQSLDLSELQAMRARQIKTDIFREIASFTAPKQAGYYAELSDILWESNRKESIVLLNKSLGIISSPATKYKTVKERVDALVNVLARNELFERDPQLARQLLKVIVKTISDEMNRGISDEYGKTLTYLARMVVEKDEKLALDLALLSLKSKKPGLDWNAHDLLVYLNYRKSPAADQYFGKMIDIVRTGKRKEDMRAVLSVVFESRIRPSRSAITETQEKLLLEVLATFIAKEPEALASAKIKFCEFTSNYGRRNLPRYKALLLRESEVVEQAISICRTPPTSGWEKLVATKNAPWSVDDFMEIAALADVPAIKAGYIYRAALKARDEKSFARSIGILDQIDLGYREKLFWNGSRINATRELVQQLIQEESYDAALEQIDYSPQHLRAAVIMGSLEYSRNLVFKNRQFGLDLIRRAKAEFEAMGVPLPITTERYMSTNPAHYWKLIDLYARFKEPEEAVKTFEEYIKIQNKLSSRFAGTNEKGTVSYFSYSTLDRDFRETYFDRIYGNIGKLDALPIRLRIRISLLDEILHRSKWIGSGGTIGLNL